MRTLRIEGKEKQQQFVTVGLTLKLSLTSHTMHETMTLELLFWIKITDLRMEKPKWRLSANESGQTCEVRSLPDDHFLPGFLEQQFRLRH